MLGEDFGVKKVQTINRRMFIIGAAKFIVFTGIIARLFSLQITENKKYLTLSDKVEYFLLSVICNENSLAIIPVNTINLAAPIINILLLMV